MHQARRHAFTTLELLVVIGIIVILGSILLIGSGHIIGSGKAKATKVTLAALNGMLGELDSKKQLDKAPAVWLWVNSGSPNPPEMYANPALGVDFWRTPFYDPLAANILRRPDALDAPPQVGEGSGSDRHAARAITNTQIVMQKMLSMPANRQALQQLSTNIQFTPDYQSGTVRSPGADLVMHSDDDETASPPTEQVYYIAGARVQYTPSGGTIKRYLCIANGTPSGADPASATTQFIEDTTPGAPLLLDGWQNPIIFVPASGLRVRKVGSKSKLDPTDKEQTVIITSPEGKTARDTASGLPYVTQVGRPFFASAGPDGDFANGDDNIYSFEP